MNNTARANLALAGVVMAWASSFIVLRAIAADIPPGAMALGRLLIATAILVPIALHAKARIPRGRPLVLVVIYGALWFGAYSVLIAWAGHFIDAGTAALLVNLAPALVVAHAAMVGRTRPGATLVIGVVIALLGSTIITAASRSVSAEIGSVAATTTGVLLALACAVLYAGGVILQGEAIRAGVSPLSSTTVGAAAATVALLPFSAELWAQVGTAPATAWWGVIWLGSISTAAGFGLFAVAQRHLSSGLVSSTTYLVPAVVIVLGWLILREIPALGALVGGTLCLLGVAITRLPQHKRQLSNTPT